MVVPVAGTTSTLISACKYNILCITQHQTQHLVGVTPTLIRKLFKHTFASRPETPQSPTGARSAGTKWWLAQLQVRHRSPRRGEERNGHKEDKTMEHLSKETTQVIMTLEAALSDMFEAIDEVQTAKMVLMQEREQGIVKTVTH